MRFKNMFLMESLSRSSEVIYKLRRVKCDANSVSSGLKIVKRPRRGNYDPVTIETTKSLFFGPSTSFYRFPYYI